MLKKLNLKLFRALARLSARLLQEEHLKEFNADLNCPSCNVWFSHSSVEFTKHHYCNTDKETGLFYWKCGCCGAKSKWHKDAPVMVLAEVKEREKTFL